MSIKAYIIDAFTTELFKRNQAAVCLLEQELSEKTMLAIDFDLLLIVPSHYLF
ncbi:Phenazine biosynthesis-like protein [Salegentibacter agarivorans]|uniref:Phenazine biosynthesis-like protein n=1 Tax=Salegentibacter agarivorans TaxID=345907 RepID=A0A1I2KTS9_9FLAO|nr:PhzF family phenazine biosynthesis protein [Salegentibacter agarivorans]SFF68491.1 Phenazine biosynthesis-like protein [Salegentibacter agarivorans]